MEKISEVKFLTSKKNGEGQEILRYKIFKIVATLLSELVGITCLVVALFAFQFGLDNNIALGTMRKILAVFGGFLIVSPLLVLFINRVIFRTPFFIALKEKSTRQTRDEKPSASDKKESIKVSGIKSFFTTKPVFWSLMGVMIVVLISVWYMTNGTMIHFKYYSNYYDLQADGFLAGKTSLLIEPAKELSTLSDPYDWKSRTGIHFVWDASYYQGKYYIYWGPVPAALAALVKLIKPGVIEDQYLLLFFVCGLSVIFASLLIFIRKKYFPNVPAWTLMFFTALTGLSTPLLFLISRPNVYETAIASCQFFLFLGLYGVVRGLAASSNQWKWLALAGIALGAAVGSRMSVVFTVFFIVGVILIVILRNFSKESIKATAALLVPLAIIACGIFWFNYVRFGSPIETGMRYQLTGEALPADFSQLFALRYIIPNTYLSLLQPFQFTPHQFPFFSATTDNSWTKFIKMPENYYFAEQVTGILYTIPFIWFLILPFIRVLQKGWRWVKEAPSTSGVSTSERVPKWLWVLLIGSCLVIFSTNMMYILTTMRYLADFSPLFLLFTSIFVMREIEHARYSSAARAFLLIGIMVLGLLTIIISFFINFTVGDRRMLNENPTLYARLEQFFNR